VISIESADDQSSAASLRGSFDRSNQWFLRKHLEELSGDVVLDCSRVERLDEVAASWLRRFRDDAAAQDRRVVFRALPARIWRALKHEP
jgi:anti-anti-sigma regulatory factor